MSKDQPQKFKVIVVTDLGENILLDTREVPKGDFTLCFEIPPTYFFQTIRLEFLPNEP